MYLHYAAMGFGVFIYHIFLRLHQLDNIYSTCVLYLVTLCVQDILGRIFQKLMFSGSILWVVKRDIRYDIYTYHSTACLPHLRNKTLLEMSLAIRFECSDQWLPDLLLSDLHFKTTFSNIGMPLIHWLRAVGTFAQYHINKLISGGSLLFVDFT